MDEARKRELLFSLNDALCRERSACSPLAEDASTEELWSLFRALVNTREPGPESLGAPAEFLADQDELLRGLIAERGIATLDETLVSPLDARMRLWRGDITALAVDAIVNAANAQMLGCWVPGHHCIDNAIHTFAGVQLRAECAAIMRAQGHEEPTGQAKVTSAYNLPAKRVIHTVGPIANGRPAPHHGTLLASCYRSCLDAAVPEELGSIAFCCISTGVFGFPQDSAARIAVDTVRAWLDEREVSEQLVGEAAGQADGQVAGQAAPVVVFNVFTAADEDLYRNLLGF